MTPDEPRPWTADAACREVEDPELFFPQGKAGRDSPVLRAGQTRAKAICADCPVTRQCLRGGTRQRDLSPVRHLGRNNT